MFVGALGVLPIYAYNTAVQPQLDSMQAMYGSMDQTAESIASGKDPAQTDTYKHAEVLSAGWKSDR